MNPIGYLKLNGILNVDLLYYKNCKLMVKRCMEIDNVKDNYIIAYNNKFNGYSINEETISYIVAYCQGCNIEIPHYDTI